MCDLDYKVCASCGHAKDKTDFYNETRRKDGLNRLCKTCISAAAAKRRVDNPERYKEYSKRAQEWREANLDRSRENQRRHRAANRELHNAQNKALREKNPAAARAACAAWGRANRGKVSAIKARRTAALLNASPAWSNPLAIDAVYEFAAQRRAAGEDVHVDHIFPLQGKLVCGLHVEYNLQILPALENIAKGARLIDAPVTAFSDPSWLAEIRPLF